MTEINTIHENAAIQMKQKQNTSSAAGFQDSFDAALFQKTAGKTEGEQPAALGEPQSPNINQLIDPSAADIVSQTDNLLGLLESYTSGLGNPKATMKDLTSLVDQIKDGADNLRVSADKSISAGNNLKEIAAQTALTATTEYIKFQRGDYL